MEVKFLFLAHEFEELKSHSWTQRAEYNMGFEVFSFFPIPPQYRNLPNFTISNSFLCNQHSPVLKDIFPLLWGVTIQILWMNLRDHFGCCYQQEGTCLEGRRRYTVLWKGSSDHDIGNASLSEKNLWTLMLEWGVVDLSVPLLVEGNPLG